MLTLGHRHSLRTYNSQIPALFNLNRYIHSYHLHYISSHPFSWSSEANKRATATKGIANALPKLKGTEEAEYPGEWDKDKGISKKKVSPSDKQDGQKRDGQTYLEDEYFGDRSPIQEIQGLIKPKLPDLDKKESLTPLAEEIKQMIHARGPITFNTYWQLCMQHPKYGYYMTKDPIGREGDFITTPEMFSGFSESLAIWCAFTWESMGKPDRIKIIEYGPGLGSVTKTLIDVIRKSPLSPFKESISGFHLIESSSRLRWKQKTKLGLGNIRKFKTRVKKPVYAVTDISPFAQRNDKDNYSSKKKDLEKPVKPISSEEYHKDSETKTSLFSLDTDPIQIAKQTKGVTPINTDPEIRLDPKKKIRPIIGNRHQNLNQTSSSSDPFQPRFENTEFKTRDDIPAELLEPTLAKKSKKTSSNILQPGEDLEGKMKQNPFNTDAKFGEMPQRMMGAMGLSGNMELTDDIKQKYEPFDWRWHDEKIFGHVDEEMKPYITGQKTDQWKQKHSEIKVVDDPLTPKQNNTVSKLQLDKIEDTSMSTSGAIIGDKGKGQVMSSEYMDGKESGVKVYDEALSEHSKTSTIPPRKTKRDIETDTKLKTQIGFDQDIYRESIAPEQAKNPFQPILDKIEMQEIGGGTGAGIDFTDLMDYEDMYQDTTFEEEEIWQSRTKDGILVSWHNSLHSIDGSAAIFICHEFFDALPISHFEFRPYGWIETVVDVDDDEETTEHFKLVRGPVATFASTVLDRQFAAKGIKPSIGQQFSLCPQGNEIANHIGKWIGKYGGAGFIIDYGNEILPAWTVQGIKQHKPSSILSKPGEVDISSHVNFNALKTSIESVKNVKVFGPVTQSYFLQGCGIIERFRQYVKDKFDSNVNKENQENKKERQDFFDTFAKIMDVDKLGGHFKVLGFCKENIGVPIGFRTPISDKQAKVDEMGLPVYK